MPISAARAAAFEILMRVEQTEAYASELLHAPKFRILSSADHRLLTELVMGVLRWRALLDQAIAKHVRSLLSKLDIEVLTTLRLGAYQILFLDRIPARAAINESVELVKRARKKSAAGMVNALLRRLSTETSSQPSPRASERLGQQAHPEWIVKRWVQAYGPEVARWICEYDQSAHESAIRIENLHSSKIANGGAPSVATSSLPENIQLEPGKILRHATLVVGGDITQTEAFHKHRLIIQDEGSQLVALLLGRGENILDCCAAPGGKTRILAQENPGAIVVAAELHPHRAALLKKLVRETNVRIVAADARTVPFGIDFDRILVDAPCSGTGTLTRNPEIKWRLKPEDLLRLQGYQLEILLSAMRRVAAGGRIVYSTCSLELEENEQVVAQALRQNDQFRVINARERLLELRETAELAWPDIESLLSGPYLRTLPGVHPCDGFFAAVLERKS
jgi:16S rRNA (cytosine967-C5)-methyltransferase